MNMHIPYKNNNSIKLWELLPLFATFQQDFLNHLELTVEKIKDYLNFLNNNKYNIPKILCSRKTKVHKILYDNDEVIDITPYDIKNDLSQLFYLDPLILYNKHIVNYEYSFDFIKQLNEFNIVKNNGLRKIFFSKIVLNLITFLDTLSDDGENYDIIIKNNTEIINNNISLLK